MQLENRYYHHSFIFITVLQKNGLKFSRLTPREKQVNDDPAMSAWNIVISPYKI